MGVWFSHGEGANIKTSKLLANLHVKFKDFPLYSNIIEPETFPMREFHHLSFYPRILSPMHINDYPEDMYIIETLANIYSTEYFCDARVAR